MGACKEEPELPADDGAGALFPPGEGGVGGGEGGPSPLMPNVDTDPEASTRLGEEEPAGVPPEPDARERTRWAVVEAKETALPAPSEDRSAIREGSASSSARAPLMPASAISASLASAPSPAPSNATSAAERTSPSMTTSAGAVPGDGVPGAAAASASAAARAREASSSADELVRADIAPKSREAALDVYGE